MGTTEDQKLQTKSGRPLATLLLRRVNPDKIAPPLLVIGSGSGKVYCFYFPYIRQAREHAGYKVWPCKVGYTDKDDLNERIAQQIPHQTGLFEPPVAEQVILTDDAKVERKIHAKLRARTKAENRRTFGGDGSGAEWFETNLYEVRRAYREVTWPQDRLRRIVEMWKTETKVWWTKRNQSTR